MCEISLVLNRGEECDHEVDSEEDADEDVYHDHLIAESTLNDEEQEDEKYSEDPLSCECRCSHEVKDYYYYLHHHDHLNYCSESSCLFCLRMLGRTETHLKYYTPSFINIA